ncbi:MAG: cation:proton antiporter, partial [Plesiomonas sp.]
MTDSHSLLVLISVAFIAGFAVQRLGLPPLVGFLLAGFGLHSVGFQSMALLTDIADIGVILLLFTIGLKLDIRQLLRREVLAGATGYTALSTVAVALLLALLKIGGLALAQSLNASHWVLLGFALSFSSTVLAVKNMQEKGELNSTYGRLALAILVIQDLFA